MIRDLSHHPVKTKILWVIPTLEAGGAQRVLTLLLNHMNTTHFTHSLVLFEKKGVFLDSVPPHTPIYELKQTRVVFGFVWLVLAMRLVRVIREQKPEIVVSFMWYPNLLSIVAKLVTGVKVIVSERLSIIGSREGTREEIIRKVGIALLYRNADRVIPVTKQMADELTTRFRIPKEQLTIISNPIHVPLLERLSHEKVKHAWLQETIPILTGVGRLTHQKGFRYLIKAIGLLMNQGVHCRLLIIGEGANRSELTSLVSDLNLEDSVGFLGVQKNPHRYVGKSTIYVLPSLYEGFPNSLTEAMALGIPCIATRCPTGPEEIITDGVNGLLVPPADEHALAAAIQRLLNDPILRKKLGEAGRKRVEDFRAEIIVKQFEDLILSVA